MEYIVDLAMTDKFTHEQVLKRSHLMRPLTSVEFIPMPYVTESSRVNLIIPVTVADMDKAMSFIDQYANTCLETGDSTFLYVVFYYQNSKPPPPPGNTGAAADNKNDVFHVLKSIINYYESRFKTGSKVAWVNVESRQTSPFITVDAVSRKLSKERLCLLGDVGMMFDIDFLNRVRMNTITNKQVFFPIAYWQYKPNLVHEKMPYPPENVITSKTGHFDENQSIHASFYNSDYMNARQRMRLESDTQASGYDAGDMYLFDMFLQFSDLSVFRAIEEKLVHRYREHACAPTMKPEALRRCMQSRAEGLAGKHELSMLVLGHRESVDRNHVDIMHQLEQNDAQVEQMNPNMLRK